MKRVTMLQTLSNHREVLVAGKTYEITDDHQLQSLLKGGVAKLENEPELPARFDDQLEAEEIEERKRKAEKKIAKLRESETK